MSTIAELFSKYEGDLPDFLFHLTTMATVHGITHVILTSMGGMEFVLGSDICASLKKTEPEEETKGREKAKKTESPSKKWHQTALDLVSSATSVILFFAYIIATLQLKDSKPSGYQSRVFGMSSLSYWAIQQHLGYNLYELIFYICVGQKDGLMYLHHFCVIANFSNILLFQYNHFYATWMGVVEGTNPFLAAVFALKRIGPPWLNSPWATIFGVGLWLSFLIIRVINLPFVFAVVVKDFSTFLKDDEKDSAIVPFFGFGVISIFFLWVLSSFWFYRITLGMLKQVQKSKKVSKES